MSVALNESSEALELARREAKEFFDAHPDPREMSNEDIEESKKHTTKMAELHDKMVVVQEVEKGREQASVQRERSGALVGLSEPAEDEAPKIKSLSDMLDDSDAYQKIVKAKRQLSGGRVTIPLGEYSLSATKTLVALTDINAAPMRRPGILASIQDESTTADLMLQGTTDVNTLTYYEETTFTNAAATVAEGGTKLESTLDFTERTDNVRKIATWIPVTDELLADVAGFRSYLEGRLRFMVERVEEQQIINGDGTAPNISGILDRTNVQTQTSGLTTEADAIYAAITKVRVNGQAEPTGIVIHPFSWANIRTSKDDNEQYYGPGPFSADNVDRLWGLPVRITPVIAEGTALVGAFRPFAQIFRREGISVVASTEHASYFIENKVAVLAESRLALAVYRPQAFCQVTGLASS